MLFLNLYYSKKNWEPQKAFMYESYIYQLFPYYKLKHKNTQAQITLTIRIAVSLHIT